MSSIPSSSINDYGHSRSLSAGVTPSVGGNAGPLHPHYLTHQKSPSSSLPSVPSSRRVWIRRPGMQATTVIVNESDIVDDLKTLILQKYPNSLARTCDPADLVIEVLYEGGNGNGNDNTPGATSIVASKGADKLPPPPTRFKNQTGFSGGSSAATAPNFLAPVNTTVPGIISPSYQANNGNGSSDGSGVNTQIASTNISMPTVATTPTTNDQYIPPITPASTQFRHSPGPGLIAVELQPDESVFTILDQYFPDGMTIVDALIVSSPISNELGSSSLSFYQRDSGHVSPRSKSTITRITAPNDSHPPINDNEDISSPSVPSRIEKPSTKQSKSTSSTRDPSSKTSRQEGSNGVLLLPRQFKLPNTSSTNNDSNIKKKAPKEESNNSTTPTSAASVPANVTKMISQQQSAESYNITAGASNPNRSMRKVSPHSFPILEGVVPQINVLIVEDNVINQKILEAFMRRKRIRCSVAKNGKEAVEKWRQGGFHLVLMDIQLPVMSGIEATKEIRRLEHDNRVGTFSSDQRVNPAVPKKEDKLDTKLFKSPVIVVALTASSSSADKSVALAAGCNDFLTKPVNLIWLEQKTIEWGCMQALIDFEGWKHWVPRQADDLSRTKQQQSKPGFRRDRSQSRSQTQQGSKLGAKSSLQRLKSSSTPVGNSSANVSGTSYSVNGSGSSAGSSNPSSSSSKRYHAPPPIVLGIPSIVPPPAIISPARPEHSESRSESETPPSAYDSRGRRPILKEAVS